MTNEIHLIKKIAEKDAISFKSLYDLYSSKVYNTAISYAQNKQDAEEITQDTFTNVFRKAHQYKGDSSVSTWIYRIATNTSLNYIKKNKRHSVFNADIGDNDRPDFEHPGILLENKEYAKELFAVIDSLSGNQKTAFILSYIEELPRQEVADVMEISLKATESLLQRAKSNLREKLKNTYPNRRKS